MQEFHLRKLGFEKKVYHCIVNSREGLTEKDAFVPLFRRRESGQFSNVKTGILV